MSKITITMEVDDYFADDEHETGVTNEGYEKLIRILGGFGFDVEVERVAERRGTRPKR